VKRRTLSGDILKLLDQLIDFINNEVSLDPTSAVVSDTDLLLTGLVDSLGIIEVVGWIEETVGVEIDPADVVLANFQTTERMVALVGRLRSEQEG
jgi:acyl carrier protein